MRPRDVLAANLRKLMAAIPALSRFPLITEASGGSLTNGTLDRVRRATHATSVDTLEEIARVFGLEPWQLLVPSLGVEVDGHGEPKLSGLPEWPFTRVSRLVFQALEPEDRAYIEGVLASEIERLSHAPSAEDLRRFAAHTNAVTKKSGRRKAA
jgi:hypothetical protein